MPLRVTVSNQMTTLYPFTTQDVILNALYLFEHRFIFVVLRVPLMVCHLQQLKIDF